MAWHAIGTLEDIPRLGSRVIKTSACEIAVFRTARDEVFALEDRCPHKGGPLSQGIVYDTRVACPLHNWVINLETGRATGADSGCSRSYPVQVLAGRVSIDLDPGHEPCIAGVSTG